MNKLPILLFCGLLLLTTAGAGFAAEPSRCGYIDKTGKPVIPPQFVSVGSFGEGLAAVCVATK